GGSPSPVDHRRRPFRGAQPKHHSGSDPRPPGQDSRARPRLPPNALEGRRRRDAVGEGGGAALDSGGRQPIRGGDGRRDPRGGAGGGGAPGPWGGAGDREAGAARSLRARSSYVGPGPAGAGPYTVVITPERAGWGYTGLRILDLPAGGTHSFECGADEVLVLPLSGSCRVDCDGQRFELAGRDNALSAVSDLVYTPRGASVTVFSETG